MIIRLIMNMGFGTNKTPVEIIKGGAFGRTYFRDIYSGEELDDLKNIDQNYYCSNYYDVNVNKYGVKCGIPLRIWENNGRTNPIDPYSWFQGYFRYWLGRRS